MFDTRCLDARTGAQALSAVVDQLASVDLDGMADAALAEEVLLLSRVHTRLSAQILRRLGVFDYRGISQANGLATSLWLSRNTHCNPGVARRDVHLARQLRDDQPTADMLADGTLSPYERNVAGWLEVAGGLGTMLGETNSTIGKILSPDQVKSMSSAVV